MAHNKAVESLAAKLIAMGYKGDLSAIAAGYTDIPEGANKISDALVDVGVELEHIENHCRDMREALDAVYKYLEGGHDQKS